MRTEQIFTIVATLLVPVITAVLGALAVAFQDWRVHRSLTGERRLVFEDAARQADFASQWWKATRELLDPSSQARDDARRCALAWLDEAAALVAGLDPLPIRGVESRVSLRRLLLIRPMHHWPAQFVRGAYFLCLAWLVLTTGEVVTDALLEPANIGPWMFVDVLVPAFLALILRTVADAAEGAGEGPGHHGGTPGGALLLRRFNRRSAKVIQVLFFLVIAGVLIQTWVTIQDLAYSLETSPEEVAQLIVLVALAIGLRSWTLASENGGA